ncbi:MAG: glycerophosphoryl diester phosphodiesterase [Neobacillus sp.]|nr:glycerophosphoryl diester phosphodiesterase [Neobacillus sp.]
MKVDRSILSANDQTMGQFADPDKLESSIKHLADVIDQNDDEKITLTDLAPDIIISGDSSLEAAQARTDEYGITFQTLLYRLNTKRIVPNHEFELIAHRGFGGLAPENTMTSFTQAVALGADSLECDVQISSDGIPVLIHDDIVDRTTNGTGNVKDLTLLQLQTLDAGSKFSTKFAGAKIPTFEDFLKFAKGRVKRIYPEIKGYRTFADIEIMINLIKQYGMEEQTVMQSMDMNALTEVRRLSSKIIIGFLKGGIIPTPEEKSNLIGDSRGMLLIDYTTLSNNSSLISELHESGVEVGTWTINDRPNFDYLLSLGVTKIMSDYYWGVK